MGLFESLTSVINLSRRLPGIRWKVGVTWINSINKAGGVLDSNVVAGVEN